MLTKLNDYISKLKKYDIRAYNWDSLIINRRKPYTYRLFTQIDQDRICLHKFDTCLSEEAFFHPHGQIHIKKLEQPKVKI